ncbi:unnamed protein product [Caenorhabditis angaria]|uniref:Uncharacterized protein n=1 Tax=Caenorhabditis angaria TaxID=860376 RepID=A0A9P1N5B2_9PELO|nr:unnamed protein product [Caenorhabditis angaria]
MAASSRCRICCLGFSTFLAIFSVLLLLICLFSASFRYNSDNMEGVKKYGLIRFCYLPKSIDISRDDDSNTKTCHLRSYINSAYCSENRNSLNTHDKSSRNCFGDFEFASILLISASIFCCILALFFAICTIFTSFGALAHSVVLIAAAICSCSGFLSYTYYYELKDNQYELIAGYTFLIHYDWAYYLFAFASSLQFLAFILSLFGSAFVLVHKNKKRQSKVQSMSL